MPIIIFYSMQLKKGSKVKFLNEIGGGRVIEIINAKMVKIETNDGFDMPCMIDDLILIEEDASNYKTTSHSTSESKKSTNNNQAQNQLSQERENLQNQVSVDKYDFIGGVKDPEGEKLDIVLALCPADAAHPTDKEIDLYLINDSSYRAFFVIAKNSNTAVIPTGAGFLEPDTKLLIGSLPQNELPLGINFNVQLLFFKNREFMLKPTEQFNISVSAIKLLRPGAYVENDFFDEKAMLIMLAGTKPEHETINPVELKEAMLTPKPKQADQPIAKKQNPALEEIDLHIEELVDSHSNLSAGEILEIQLARFTTVLDGAIKHKGSNVVFIHGVGNGKLKYELRKLLDTKYKHIRYQDASFKEYGYGATLVIVK